MRTKLMLAVTVLLACAIGAVLYRGLKPGGALAALTDKRLNLSYEFSAGFLLLNHDFRVTNTTGEALTEAHLQFDVVGENGSLKIDRYWASWPLGQTQRVSIPIDQISNVQRISVTGRADQGVFDATWIPSN